ncbi:hypothetical protein HOLleu_02252 [Holothuria leucospilota]|uniref:Solute-binding protein family 3/N-terminal domain-containing protein n=1 Tax=Holothuria leucospilota TaxID=206669 RepID=A0A9Q1HKR7_HOLLE|nr:hypothetical protein HOLleu_02252 [Holothuria leucospilota]
MEQESSASEALNQSTLALTAKKHREAIPLLLKYAVVGIFIVCLFLTVLAIILASACRACPYDSESDKTWIFSVSLHGANVAYVDNRTGAIRGYNVDVINAVCKTAGKRCDVIWDIDANCWDSIQGKSARGGVGLLGGWYDGCAGWISTKARNRTFSFTKPYFKGPYETLWQEKSNATFGRASKDISGARVGFVDGWHTDEFCLQELVEGFDTETSEYKHYGTIQELVEAVLQDKIDLAFCSDHPYLKQYLEPVLTSRNCAIEGPAVMHRKDSKLSNWWNPSLEKVLQSEEYQNICEDLKKAHGHMPGRDSSHVCLGM